MADGVLRDVAREASASSSFSSTRTTERRARVRVGISPVRDLESQCGHHDAVK
jgi:hypothetical protein